MANIIELNKQIRESEAYKIHIFVGVIRTNHEIVVRNFAELHGYLVQVENPESIHGRWSVEGSKREELENVMSEVTRLLFNFIASCSARIESTRKLMKERYKGTAFFRRYQQEVNRLFFNDPLSAFVETMRNYCLHYSLPFANAHKRFTKKEGFRQFFALDRDQLLLSGFFDDGAKHKKGREYLRQSPEQIVIREFTSKYFVKIHNFQSWFEREIYALHKKDLEWLYATSAELDRQWKRIYGSSK